MMPYKLKILSLATFTLILLGCSENKQCGIPKEWEALLNKAPTAHANIVVNIRITEGGNVKWNNVATEKRVIIERIKQISDDFPLPFLSISADSACRGNAEMLIEISRNYPCSRGACGLFIDSVSK